MKFLLDCQELQVLALHQAWPQLVLGQLLTPLTRFKLCPGLPFGVDNGAFSRFDEARWSSLLRRNAQHASRCLFVALPDVVGSAIQTDALWNKHRPGLPAAWPAAYVAQDGSSASSIPDDARCVFIGGTDAFKDSPATLRACRHWVRDGLHVHVGRVNNAQRFSPSTRPVPIPVTAVE